MANQLAPGDDEGISGLVHGSDKISTLVLLLPPIDDLGKLNTSGSSVDVDGYNCHLPRGSATQFRSEIATSERRITLSST